MILRLGSSLGPILWQLPPQLPFDRARADEFLSALPEDVPAAERLARRHDARTTGRSALRAPDGRDRPLRYALEVRHASWLSDEALGLLSRRDVALVAADTAGRHPRSLRRTSRRLAYVRLHGARRLYEGPYTGGELRYLGGAMPTTGRARARRSSPTSTTTATRRRSATRWSSSPILGGSRDARRGSPRGAPEAAPEASVALRFPSNAAGGGSSSAPSRGRSWRGPASTGRPASRIRAWTWPSPA